MAGHSKWNNIKRKKGVNDARRGKLWSKLAKNLIVAAKAGGGDPASNLTLRYAVEKAREANMPTDTIDKAIKKGTGEGGAAEYAPAVYEGYGPGGVAFIVEALTDNPNRTAPEIKKIFERAGGNLGAANCVSWNFATKGVFAVAGDVVEEEKLMEIALEAGADDIRQEGDAFEVTCEVNHYEAVKKALADNAVSVQSAEISKIPGTTVKVEDVDLGGRILKLIESFEDHDDVQHVYSNFDMPDEIMRRIG